MVKVRLRRHHAVASEVHRVAIEQLDRALAQAAGDDLEVAVHDVRRRTKELRALAKLVRPVAPEVVEWLNPALRDAARRICEARDATAVLETLDRLVAAHPADGTDAVTRVRVGLERRRAGVDPAATRRALASVCGDLREISAKVATWELQDHGFDTVAPGLTRSYRRARNRMEDAYATGTTEAFHEWRKRAKDHRYQVALLRSCWPRMMRAREDALHELTDLLGGDHDLAILSGLLQSDPGPFGGVEVAAIVIALVERQRSELQRDARVLGARCFAEGPDRFTARLRACWDAAGPQAAVVDVGSPTRADDAGRSPATAVG